WRRAAPEWIRVLRLNAILAPRLRPLGTRFDPRRLVFGGASRRRCDIPRASAILPDLEGGTMRLSNTSRLAVNAAAFLGAATLLYSQVTTARLEGFLRDSSDAVIPGVAVVAVHESTHISYEAVTNESGLYVFAKLPPGRYTVTAELAGFKRFQVTGIVLEVG